MITILITEIRILSVITTTCVGPVHDPYVVLSFGGQRKRTRTVRASALTGPDADGGPGLGVLSA